MVAIERSTAWLAEWNKTIGASRAGAVAGHSRFSTPRRVAEEMLGIRPRPDLSRNPDIIRGTLLEPVAMRVYEMETGHEITPHPPEDFVYHEDYPFAHSLPDGWVDAGCIAEIKVPRPMVWERQRLYGIEREYVDQVLHSMEICQATCGMLILMHPVTMGLLCQQIDGTDPAHQEATGSLMETEAAFWERLQAGELPPEDAPAAKDEPIPAIGGELQIINNPQVRAAALSLLECDQISSEAVDLYQDAKRRLLELTQADAVEIPGLLRFYHRMQPGRRTFDTKAALAADPTLERFFNSGEPFRSFRHYDLRDKE